MAEAEVLRWRSGLFLAALEADEALEREEMSRAIRAAMAGRQLGLGEVELERLVDWLEGPKDEAAAEIERRLAEKVRSLTQEAQTRES